MFRMSGMGDGRIVEIEMWEEGFGKLDAREFFDDGKIKFDDNGIAIVDDLDYCIDYARDWENSTGDFYLTDEEEADKERMPERFVLVTPLCFVFQCGDDETGTGDGVILDTFYTMEDAERFADGLNSALSEEHTHCYIPIDESGEDHW